MRILYYTWNENSFKDMTETLRTLGHEVRICDIPCQNYEQDAALAAAIQKAVKEQKSDSIFSFNFFPIIARQAEKLNVKYVSWIYDCPHWTLYSPASRGSYTYIFAFDRMQYLQLKALGAPNCYHFPLAVNTTRLSDLRKEKECGTGPVISFVGSLYENNLYDQVKYLPDYVRGYLSGVMEAQERIYGYNFVEELLTEEIVEEMNRYISMEMPKGYQVSKRELYGAMINAKITSQERIHMLERISARFPLALYTASDSKKVPKAKALGIVGYEMEMPRVFCSSKINLNITLRSIQSGIPLRALDVLGSGGFLLSNYQPELAEFFEDGKELVLFGSAQELEDKAAYYLAHEQERLEIASKGLKKAREIFSYEKRVQEMFSLAFSG